MIQIAFEENDMHKATVYKWYMDDKQNRMDLRKRLRIGNSSVWLKDKGMKRRISVSFNKIKG